MSNEVFSLDDLRSEIPTTANEVVEETKTIREVSIEEIAPYQNKPDPGEEYVKGLFADLDNAISKEKEKITELQQDYFERQAIKDLDSDISGYDKTEFENGFATAQEPTPVIKKVVEPQPEPVVRKEPEPVVEEVQASTKVSLTIDDEEDFFKDIDAELGEDEDEEILDEDKEIEEIKKDIKTKITPIVNSIDLSKFTINNKPVSITRLLSNKSPNHNLADWVLYSSGRSITVSEMSGPEIEKLDPRNSGTNRLNTYKNIYETIYKHIVDSNKPEFETWLKSLNFFDINHLYYAIYKACFNGTNSIPYSCPECGKMFMQDMEIDKLIKYKSDEVKENVRKILAKDTTTNDNNYQIELKQISDKYVVALRDPSVYSVIFETASLTEDFTNKYRDLLGIISYIDGFYLIDMETSSLTPISTSPDPDDMVKTTMRKIKIYYEILSSLNSDQYYNLNAYIKTINDRSDELSYVLPEVTCPKCHKKIEEQAMAAENLLFTRHRLGAIVNT